MPELIAASLADYESRALNLARHPAALSRLREALSRNRETSPLFDTARFCRNLEAVYREMGRRAGQGEKARTLIIDDDAAAITT
jgi:predicted O-linked N-acetylglucosamine transferase (SPINDLY family)